MSRSHRPSILIVEDNAALTQNLVHFLRPDFRVDAVTTFHGGVQHIALRQTPYDIVIVDYSLPDGTGLELISQIIHDNNHTKICVLTSNSDETLRMEALKLGADAFLTKPLTPRSIQLHLKTLLKRGPVQRTAQVMYADLNFDTQSRMACRLESTVRLSQRESEFLRIFLQTHDGHVTKDDLQQIYWEKGHSTITRSAVHVTIQRLRKKLQPLQVTIESIYGLGYRLQLT